MTDGVILKALIHKSLYETVPPSSDITSPPANQRHFNIDWKCLKENTQTPLDSQLENMLNVNLNLRGFFKKSKTPFRMSCRCLDYKTLNKLKI